MSKKSLLVAAVVLVVLGVFSMLFLNGSKPEAECSANNSRTSGFVDNEKNCPISIESWTKINDYNSKPKLGRIAGLVLILGGVAVGVVGLVKKSGGANSPAGKA